MRHRLFIPAATALLFALAACTQDELAGDNRLPEGEYPVFIRATGLSVEATPLAASSTRAAVDGDWQGVTSVALKMGDAVKEYTVTASTDFKSATLSRENDPHYWTNRNKFVLGPSGSGKSFFMNHLVRQYYEQGAHVVLVAL